MLTLGDGVGKAYKIVKGNLFKKKTFYGDWLRPIHEGIG